MKNLPIKSKFAFQMQPAALHSELEAACAGKPDEAACAKVGTEGFAVI